MPLPDAKSNNQTNYAKVYKQIFDGLFDSLLTGNSYIPLEDISVDYKNKRGVTLQHLFDHIENKVNSTYPSEDTDEFNDLNCIEQHNVKETRILGKMARNPLSV